MWELSIKKVESWKIHALELWCWRRHLRVPWTARRSNQSILREINPECSLEGLMLKPKLQYFGHLMWRADSLEKTLMLETLKAGGEGDNREWDDWMVSLAWRTRIWASSRSWWWTGKPGVLQSMSQSGTQLSKWTITTHLNTFPNQPLSNSVFFYQLHCIPLYDYTFIYLLISYWHLLTYL